MKIVYTIYRDRRNDKYVLILDNSGYEDVYVLKDIPSFGLAQQQLRFIKRSEQTKAVGNGFELLQVSYD